MKSVTLTQQVTIEGKEYPAGTKIGLYASLPGISFDYVFGLLGRGCVEVADDDGSGIEGDSPRSLTNHLPRSILTRHSRP